MSLSLPLSFAILQPYCHWRRWAACPCHFHSYRQSYSLTDTGSGGLLFPVTTTYFCIFTGLLTLEAASPCYFQTKCQSFSLTDTGVGGLLILVNSVWQSYSLTDTGDGGLLVPFTNTKISNLTALLTLEAAGCLSLLRLLRLAILQPY